MVLLIALLILAVAAIAASVVALRTDGYGRRPIPPGESSWEQGVRPFR